MAFLIAFSLALSAQDYERADRDDRCIRCHVDPAEEVKGSVHAQAKVGCIACHGADEIDRAKSRGNPHRRLSTFRLYRRQMFSEECGSCHELELASFRESGHFAATKRGSGEPGAMRGCVECHGYHATPTPDPKPIFDEHCGRCHEAGTEEARQGAAFLGSVLGLKSRLSDVDAAVRRLRRSPGISTREAESAHRDATGLHEEMDRTQHSARFAALAARAEQETEAVGASYNRLLAEEHAFRRRWILLLPFAGFITLSGVLILIKGRKLRRAPSS